MNTHSMNESPEDLKPSGQPYPHPHDVDSDPMTDQEFQTWAEEDAKRGLEALNRAALENPAPQLSPGLLECHGDTLSMFAIAEPPTKTKKIGPSLQQTNFRWTTPR